jgi:hypothetical protein
LALIVRYILEFKLKKLLLIILLLSQPIYADSNGMSKLIIPEDTICYETEPLFGGETAQEAIEREIAEFEANLAKELADQAAQEIMAEIEAEAKTKAKLPKLQPTVCKANRGGYEAYILGIKN